MPVSEKNEAALREDAVAVCHRLAQLGLIGAAEGNVSIRLGPHEILTTPSGTNKALITESELVIADAQGKLVAGKRKPSSELAMHLAIYQARPEVAAVVHAHPLTAVAVTLAGIDLGAPFLPEEVTALGGGIPTARYQTPSTKELAASVVQALQNRQTCLMERHGAVAVGRDIFEAADRLETVERVAQIVLRTRLMGCNPTPLPVAEIERLLAIS